MKFAKTLLNLFIYGLLIPLVVFILADLAIRFSCKYYWGEEIMGFKLKMSLYSHSIYLTFIYYIFCFLFKITKSKINRYWLTSIFILVPILHYNITSRYDYRITISFALFHITYYVLFFSIRFIISRLFIKKENSETE